MSKTKSKAKTEAKKDGEIKVESGVEINKFPKPGRRSRFPWASMAVGDSFEIETEEANRSKRAGELTTNGNNWAKRNESDARFEARVTSKGVRVWRIA